MQPIDPTTLFSIFEQGDEEIYKEYGVKDALSNPIVLIGTVIRGIENWMMMDAMYLNRYPKTYKLERNKIRYKYYNKLYKFLTDIDLVNLDENFDIGKNFHVLEVENGIQHLIKYFEKREEYEKCAEMKKVLDRVLVPKVM